MYFPKHKLATEVDVEGHTDRDESKENEREEKIKKDLNVNLLQLILMQKINDIFVEIGKIQN